LGSINNDVKTVDNGRSDRIGLASDHAGYAMKVDLIQMLRELGYEVLDYGCDSVESCDYPDYAHPLAKAVVSGECRFGISLCGSGNGINMVVNKYRGIRSALCWNSEIAALARSHNDANICAIPARFLSTAEARSIVTTFLHGAFDGGRHLRRIQKIDP